MVFIFNKNRCRIKWKGAEQREAYVRQVEYYFASHTKTETDGWMDEIIIYYTKFLKRAEQRKGIQRGG